MIQLPRFLVEFSTVPSHLAGGDMAASKTPTVSSVERTLHILELLATSRAGLTLPEISRRLGLPKSSAHCLLLTLERCGYLTSNTTTRRFMFGLKLFSLANMAHSGVQLREQARPFLRSLVNETGLTVHMGIRERDEVVLVEKIGPATAPKLATWLGKRMDLHCTGVGKAVLAHLPDQELESFIRARGLPRHNENTIASIRRLREKLAEVRSAGYALDDEEDEIGTRCIGAPIFDPAGTAIAAVSLAGTTDQITSDNLGHFAGLVKQTAGAISHTLRPEESPASEEPSEPPAQERENSIAQGI